MVFHLVEFGSKSIDFVSRDTRSDFVTTTQSANAARYNSAQFVYIVSVGADEL